MVPAPLSFLQAARAYKSGTISWDEYIHSLMARCAGVVHEEDESDDWHTDLRRIDAFAHSIWSWSRKIEPVKGWFRRDLTLLLANTTLYRHQPSRGCIPCISTRRPRRWKGQARFAGWLHGLQRREVLAGIAGTARVTT
jgi:hypothetical protein